MPAPDDAGGDDSEQGGPPNGSGPPKHVDLPDSIPDRIRERILSGRTVRRDTGDGDVMEGQI
ncbi:MAG: hypothetical protein ACI8XM_000246 [Haloarculaceae archaeon]|jgi:hypothetical protein